MNITQRVGREIKRQVRRVTRRVMGMTDGWESDDSNEEASKNYADGAQSSSRRRGQSESRSAAPSPGPLSRRASLPSLRVISATPQVNVEKIRQPLGEVRRARAPEPRRTSVEPPEDVRSTMAARDFNGNFAEKKMNLAVKVWDIKPTYRLVEPPPRVSIIQCQNNISMLSGKGNPQDDPKNLLYLPI